MSQYLDGSTPSRVRLGDVVRTRPGNSKLIKGKLPAARSEGLFAAYSASGQDVFAPHYEYDGNGVVISAVGARCGKCFLAAGKWTGIANTHALLPDETRITAKFLWYQVNDERFWVRGGSAQPFVRVKDSLEKLIYAPELAAQHNIVAEIEKQFSRLDEAVASLQRVKANLKRYRAGVLDEFFGDEPNARLGDAIEIAPQNGLYLPKSAYGAGSPILRIDDYQTDWIRPAGELRRVAASEAQVAAWALREGDLVINRVNSISHLGKCVSVPAHLAGALFESNMMRLGLRASAVPRYVELYLGGSIGRRRLTQQAKWAVNQASINQQDVMATPLPLPDVDAQRRIVAEVDRRLSIVREVEADVDANLKRAQALRQAVLQCAFAGA